MLTSLQISNYAIIQNLQIKFEEGLTIITGETGAGKSILTGALNLILGERADASALMNKDEKCIIEASFNVKNNKQIADFLNENELDDFTDLIIRREIAMNGKSRAFINDTPVNLQQLKKAGSLLVDMHQQFDTIELGNEIFQRNVLDALAGQQQQVIEFSNLYSCFQKEQRHLQLLKENLEQLNKEEDYNKFLLTELDQAHLKENEIEELDKELEQLSKAENIKSAINSSIQLLSENENAVLVAIKQMLHQLEPFTPLNENISKLYDRINSSYIELKDISGELEAEQNKTVYDEKRINEVSDRISEGYRLFKKHGVHSTNELLSIKNSLEEKVGNLIKTDEEINNKQKQVQEIEANLDLLGRQLFEKRKKQIPAIEKNIKELLVKTGMPNATLKIDISISRLNAFGMDDVVFLFDANNSGNLMPLKKVASGGELSRLMLCIKSLVAGKINLPTMIFDEIDSGISGEAARQVGLIMKNLSSKRQIICITHQPQIAGRATHHYFVFKKQINNKVQTGIKYLNDEERVTAIAEMIGGNDPGHAAIENAKALIMQP